MGRAPGTNRTGWRAALALGLLLAGPSSLRARTLLTQDEALRIAFPGDAASRPRIERETHYLTGEQRARASRLAGSQVKTELWARYVARQDGEVVGTAYFDSHEVRSLRETLMVVVTPEGKVLRVEVVAFAEPPEYLAKKAWYEQFRGRELSPDLETGRAIRSITGATLTSRAAVQAVRRVLAVHQVLAAEVPSGPRAEGPAP